MILDISHGSGRRWGVSALLFVALLSPASCLPEGAPEMGRVAPAYRAETLAGDTLSLDDLRGQAVLLNVWATWCLPCRAEMPELQILHERYADRGLRILGVSTDRGSSREGVELFVRELGLTFTILLDPREEVVRTFRTLGVPETFLLDSDGVLRHHWPGRFVPTSEANLSLVEAALPDRERSPPPARTP